MNSLPDDFWGRVVYLLQQYGPSFLRGAGTTMLIAVISTAVGCLIGFGVGIVQTTPTDKAHPVKYFLMKLVRFLLDAYVEIFRGTPMMVQAMFIYYGLAQLFNIHLGTMEAALFIVSINTGAYMAESVRGGIISIDPGQTEGAKAIGMTHFQTMVFVILPQAIRNILPQIGNNFIINIKDSSVLSVISITELMFMSKSAGGTYFQFVPAYVICAVIYFILTFTITRILRLVEKKMDGDDSYVICGSQTDFRSQINAKKEDA